MPFLLMHPLFADWINQRGDVIFVPPSSSFQCVLNHLQKYMLSSLLAEWTQNVDSYMGVRGAFRKEKNGRGRYRDEKKLFLHFRISGAFWIIYKSMSWVDFFIRKGVGGIGMRSSSNCTGAASISLEDVTLLSLFVWFNMEISRKQKICCSGIIISYSRRIPSMMINTIIIITYYGFPCYILVEMTVTN